MSTSKTVFFSWQVDTPSKTGRNFLRGVLEEACKKIVSDTSIDEALRDIEVDSDTQGVAGQPPIVDTIFRKIDASAVFIADMTFVGKRGDDRPTPNPNVLIEYGWALKGLRHERIICVMNAAYGKPSNDSLPFDLKHVRWPICYNLPEDATPEIKEKEKKNLIGILSKAISASLATVPPSVSKSSPGFPAAEAKDGPARFRSRGEPLGFKDDIFSGSEEEVSLREGAAIWIRLMPLNDPGKRWPSYDLKNKAIQNNKMLLAPPYAGYSGYDFLRAEDGEGLYGGVPQLPNENGPGTNTLQIYSVAFAFETGEVWGVDTALMEYHKKSLPFIEGYFVKSVQNYSLFLQSLGVQPPYHWVAGIVGAKGRHLDYPTKPGYYRAGTGPLCTANLIEASGEYDGKQDASVALLPLFNRIFEKCGMERPDYLSQ